MPVRRLKPPPSAGPLQRMIPTTPEERTSFLRMVSHELRTPLNSIIGFSEILNSQVHGPLGAPQYAEYAGIIRDSGYKMLKLVNQVLELIRLAEGMVRLDVRPAKVGHAILDAIDLVRTEALEKGVTVSFAEPDGELWALADVRALRSVLDNLLQNAVQFSPPGGTVRLSLSERGERAQVEIADSGPGIEVNDLDRVLRPFEQGDYALTRTTAGAGLGLPTARLLCEVMGGQLSLENGAGGGLVARVALVAAQPDEVVRGDRRA
jgi:signal transduction histidine kinase